jgi:hypothetical protein
MGSGFSVGVGVGVSVGVGVQVGVAVGCGVSVGVDVAVGVSVGVGVKVGVAVEVGSRVGLRTAVSPPRSASRVRVRRSLLASGLFSVRSGVGVAVGRGGAGVTRPALLASSTGAIDCRMYRSELLSRAKVAS